MYEKKDSFLKTSKKEYSNLKELNSRETINCNENSRKEIIRKI